MRKEPGKFDNEHANLKSYITDLDEAAAARLAKKTYALEQNPQQAQIAKEIKAELDNLIEKHQIKVNVDKQLDFE